MFTTKRKLEGEFTIDNRASGDGLREFATITCSHCQKIVIINPQRTRERRWCRSCDKYICDFCPPFECKPMDKVLDELQNKAMKNG